MPGSTAGGTPTGAVETTALPIRQLHVSGLVLRFINTTTFVASIFGSGEARRGSIPRSGAVTEEQRSQNRKAAQPFGRRFFLAQTSLLTPYRPLKGMRVARASSGPKIPRRKRGRIYEMEYLGLADALSKIASVTNSPVRSADATIKMAK